MSAELVMLLATAVLAVVAITAAVIAVRAARVVVSAPGQPVEPPPVTSSVVARVEQSEAPARPTLPVRVVEGSVVVPPSQQQVVTTALGRPEVRLSVFTRGIAHALRPESRDRILGLMRREYRQRRRERLKAGRQAVRSARPAGPDTWMSS